MYHKHHTRGVVISGRLDGDSNRLISLFTEDFGLVYAKVQGAKNIRSKLRGSVQDFSLSGFSMIRGKSGWKVVSARPIKNFFEILKNNPDKIKIAGNVLNLIKKLTSEEAHLSYESNKESVTPLFEIVLNLFNFLESNQGGSIILAEALTLMRILHHLGYMKNDPDLSLPLESSEIESKDLEIIAPRRSKIITIINESLKIV